MNSPLLPFQVPFRHTAARVSSRFGRCWVLGEAKCVGLAPNPTELIAALISFNRPWKRCVGRSEAERTRCTHEQG